MANNAKMMDVHSLLAAGINPKTGLPIKLADADDLLKTNIRKQIRVLDEQDAVNSGQWYGLPNGLTSQMVERMLYYKGQLMFFYEPHLKKFFLLPYALDGEIDIYGRYMKVRPVPMGSTEAKNDKDKLTPLGKYITSLEREPLYDIWLDEVKLDTMDTKCALLYDYSPQLGQTIIPRQQLQDPLIDVMSECIPFMRTNLLNATGVVGMRVNSEDEYVNVELASESINRAALNGKKYVPVVGNVDFQEMTGGNVGRAEDFLLSMQSLDNLRLSFHGLGEGGIFEKKAHELEAEHMGNASNVGLVLQDRVMQRQHFCNIVNSVWGLGIWYEPSETISNADVDGNGVLYNNAASGEGQPLTSPAAEPVQEGGEQNA